MLSVPAERGHDRFGSVRRVGWLKRTVDAVPDFGELRITDFGIRCPKYPGALNAEAVEQFLEMSAPV